MFSLSNLLNNVAEEVYKITCKDCNHFRESESDSNNLIKYKFLFCNKNYSSNVDKKIIDINKLISFSFQKR